MFCNQPDRFHPCAATAYIFLSANSRFTAGKASRSMWGTNVIAAELMKYRTPVGGLPSSNTYPRWASHRLHDTSFLIMKWKISFAVFTLQFDSGAQKVGHFAFPLNFAAELNSAFPQQTHRYVPLPLKSWYLPE